MLLLRLYRFAIFSPLLNSSRGRIGSGSVSSALKIATNQRIVFEGGVKSSYFITFFVRLIEIWRMSDSIASCLWGPVDGQGRDLLPPEPIPPPATLALHMCICTSRRSYSLIIFYLNTFVFLTLLFINWYREI